MTSWDWKLFSCVKSLDSMPVFISCLLYMNCWPFLWVSLYGQLHWILFSKRAVSLCFSFSWLLKETRREIKSHRSEQPGDTCLERILGKKEQSSCSSEKRTGIKSNYAQSTFLTTNHVSLRYFSSLLLNNNKKGNHESKRKTWRRWWSRWRNKKGIQGSIQQGRQARIWTTTVSKIRKTDENVERKSWGKNEPLTPIAFSSFFLWRRRMKSLVSSFYWSFFFHFLGEKSREKKMNQWMMVPSKRERERQTDSHTVLRCNLPLYWKVMLPSFLIFRGN